MIQKKMIKSRILGFVALFAFALSCNGQSPKIIAHRGFWDTENSAQNSISSIYRAAEIECYAIEFDVHITSDDVLVVFHDDAIIEGQVIGKTQYDEIRDYRLNNGERLPTLEQFFVHAKNCPKLKLVLEVKTDMQGQEYEQNFLDKLMAMVDKFELQNRMEYISFNLDICKQLAQRCPQLPVAYLGGGVTLQELYTAGVRGVDYHYGTFKTYPELVSQAHKLGMTVNVWTVNGEDVMKEMIDLQVDYITTDKPEMLLQMIKNK